MSNLNINQKVAMASLKKTEAKRKDSHLSESELRLKEFTEVIKPHLSEDQLKLLEKYHTKLSALNIREEINTYEFVKKYDWNSTILDSLTDVLIQKKEEANTHDDWVTVARPSKVQPQQHHLSKKSREAEDVRRRPQRDEEGGFEAEGNYRDRSRNFRSKARRGQSVDPNKKNYQEYEGGQREYRQGGRNRRQQHQQQGENPQEDQQFDRERQNKEFREFRDSRDRNNNRRNQHRDQNENQEHREPREHRDPREQREQRGRNNRGRAQKEEVITMYVKKGEQKQEEEIQERPKSRKNAKEDQQGGKRGRQEKVYYVKKGAENQASHPAVAKNIAKAYLEGGDGAWQNDVEDEEIEVPKTQTETISGGKIQESPSRHYNEHNIHEFFKTNPANEGSNKKEQKKEVEQPKSKAQPEQPKSRTQQAEQPKKTQAEQPRPKTQAEQPRKTQTEQPKKAQPKPKPAVEERSSPLVPRVENDHTSQTAQKPLVENPSKTKEKAQPETVHEQPIGSYRPATQQNTQATHVNTQQQQQQAPTTTTQPTQQTSQENLLAQQQGFGGFPQYMQQPYMMPQQAFFNPYMQYYQQQQQQQGQAQTQPQTQTQGQKDQQQPQGSYPPGFNPQDMSSMYQLPQVPFILIPQPNGTTILQPMYQMMPPQMMGQDPNSTNADQQKLAQQYYQFPMTMPMQGAPFGYYQNDASKSPQQQTQGQKYPSGHHDNKNTAGGQQQQQQPNTGSFFNFGPNPTTDDHKKNQQQQQQVHGGYQQQAGGYPFMPFMMPTNMGQYQGQQQQGQGGHGGWK
jgi:hypothetical protein